MMQRERGNKKETRAKKKKFGRSAKSVGGSGRCRGGKDFRMLTGKASRGGVGVRVRAGEAFSAWKA